MPFHQIFSRLIKQQTIPSLRSQRKDRAEATESMSSKRRRASFGSETKSECPQASHNGHVMLVQLYVTNLHTVLQLSMDQQSFNKALLITRLMRKTYYKRSTIYFRFLPAA